MGWRLLCCILSLPVLLSAQSCIRITADDLGSSDSPSSSGLIAAALAAAEADTPSTLQLLNYSRVCEAVGTNVERYRFVSIVAEYCLNDSVLQSQFEFSCNSSELWDIVVSGATTEIVTTPPDATFNTPLRTDCYQCLNPRRRGSINNNTQHCIGEFRI